jgi:hypothetical protein
MLRYAVMCCDRLLEQIYLKSETYSKYQSDALAFVMMPRNAAMNMPHAHAPAS